MDDDFAATSYGAVTRGRDLAMLRAVSTGCVGGGGAILAILCLV